MELFSLIILVAVSFASSVMGTMIGMAMLVLLPVMIFLGMPVHTAIATGRFSMIGVSIGNITKFSRNQKIQPKYVAAFALAGVIGSFMGASFLTGFSESMLKLVIGVFMILVSILVLFEGYLKPKGVKHKTKASHHVLSGLAGLFIGGYIGVIGGGGATIVIFLLILIYGLSFHQAVANQKAVTLPISVIATLVFMFQGLIDYKIGILLFIVNVIGGWVGASLVLKFDSCWLKRIMVPISVIMAIKLIFF
ncbi:MAG: sulfite exporter TauE/SafE family protein [Nanoarchaeota archaeon]